MSSGASSRSTVNLRRRRQVDPRGGLGMDAVEIAISRIATIRCPTRART
jgi:hypothetical protein